MEHFRFVDTDSRARFANHVLSMLYLKYDCQTGSKLFHAELSRLCNHLESNVRNIYEVIDDQIPLMALNNVLKYGSKGYNEWEEYSTGDALDIIDAHCYKLYRFYKYS